MKRILETRRLYLREMAREDYPALCLMLRDAQVMYAYEHAFGEAEAWEWLERQLKRYAEWGFGLWAVIHKETEELIGQCGLTLQQTGEEVEALPLGKGIFREGAKRAGEYPGEGQALEVGYLFRKEFWGQGYAAEAARACRDYAFEILGAEEVFSIIRENNFPSRRVAERNGMRIRGATVKRYYGMDMKHLAYSVRRWEKGTAS